jgi:hypothetical protein
MAKLSDKQAAAWARTRQLGRSSFVWRRGVLAWGVPMAIAWPLVMGFFKGWEELTFLVPISLIIFPIGGMFFGRKLWDAVERNYEGYVRDNPAHDSVRNG